MPVTQPPIAIQNAGVPLPVRPKVNFTTGAADSPPDTTTITISAGGGKTFAFFIS